MSDIVDRMQKNSKKKQRRELQFILRDLMIALVLCNNVTPSYHEGVVTYQASSPDEIAFVKFCESINLKLLKRDQNTIHIQLPNKKRETYTILEIFPFKSSTKRMGILVQHQETKRIIFYLKGADSTMFDKVKEVYKGFLKDESENIASSGFRTLVFA